MAKMDACSTVQESTVASNLGDIERSASAIEELLQKFGSAVDQVNSGAHRPPATPERDKNLVEPARTSLLARLEFLNKRFDQCRQQFGFELSALSAQLPQ